jgi:dTDP-4-amino-4,6-dideoxygalactose transaminase
MPSSTDTPSIPIFRLAFDEVFIARFQSGCADIFASDSLTNGAYVRRFEELFAKSQGAPHALAVGSGTDALEIAFRAVGVAGKQVIVPTNTFIATAIAAERAGAEIVLADIEDETFSISPDELRRKLTPRTAAVSVVHIGGIISRHIDEIAAICRAAGVPLVEDAAQAQGASRAGRPAGMIGAIGCFSFFPTKVMTTAEGGMITTADPALHNRMKSIRNFGRDLTNELVCINEGANFKLTEFQALLGVLEMERVAARIEARRRIGLFYQTLLSGSRSFQPVLADAGAENSYYKQIVKTSLPQAELHRFCKERNISLTGEVYRFPLHMQPVYRARFAQAAFPVADAFSAGHICPPVYPELDEGEVHRVVETLLAAESALRSR